MTAVETQTKSSIQYPERTLKRAERAIRCSPFQLKLFSLMRYESVNLNVIAGQSGVNAGYTSRAIAELVAENAILWLIQVGVLRREVDGQGITDSFRLTPLGRQLVEQWENQNQNLPVASLCDRISNSFNRWLRLPL